jgi:CRISPR type III-B/RAMP module-associated protein Cmr3
MGILVFLEPLDTCLFRDARSFGVEENTFAASELPSGLTVYGALGSMVLEKHGVSLGDFVYDKAPRPLTLKLGRHSADLASNHFRVHGPFLAVPRGREGMTAYFPAPANLMFCKGAGQSVRTFPSLPRGDEPGQEGKWDLSSDHPTVRPLRLPPNPGYTVEWEESHGFFSQSLINTFLKGDLRLIQRGDYYEEEDFFLREDRNGVHIDPVSRTVVEGYLFGTQHLRFKDSLHGNRYAKAGVVVLAHNLEADDFEDCCVFLGGERRQASVKVLGERDNLMPEDADVLNRIVERKRFFFYLACPAVFNKGWCRIPWPLEDGACMVGAAVRKPGKLTGWSRGSSRTGWEYPRKLHRTAPAGILVKE